MITTNSIKDLLKPTQVAKHYLGYPAREQGNNIWYKSPFRPEERTASFLVNDSRGFHDFGTSEHFDIISFVQRLYNTDFKNAMSILSRDFGIQDDYRISDTVAQYLIQKRQQEKEIEIKINNWYNQVLQKICNELKEWERINPHISGEALEIAYDRQAKLEIYFEYFYMAKSYQERVELYKSREGWAI